MKNFINIRDISSKDLRKILIDAKSRKKLEIIKILWKQIRTLH